MGQDAWASTYLPLDTGTWLDQGPWLQSFFSKKGEAVCGKQPWGLFIEVTGNLQSQNLTQWLDHVGLGRGFANCSQLALSPPLFSAPRGATKPG